VNPFSTTRQLCKEWLLWLAMGTPYTSVLSRGCLQALTDMHPYSKLLQSPGTLFSTLLGQPVNTSV